MFGFLPVLRLFSDRLAHQMEGLLLYRHYSFQIDALSTVLIHANHPQVNSFNPNLRNSLPERSCCLDGERGNPHSPCDSNLGLHQDSLMELLGTIPVLPNQTPGFPAYLIIPELIPHTLVIDPVSGSKDQKKDKHSCKGKTHNIQSRFEELSQEQEKKG